MLGGTGGLHVLEEATHQTCAVDLPANPPPSPVSHLTFVQVEGRENLPPSDRAVVYVANHQSFLVGGIG